MYIYCTPRRWQLQLTKRLGGCWSWRVHPEARHTRLTVFVWYQECRVGCCAANVTARSAARESSGWASVWAAAVKNMDRAYYHILYKALF